MQPASPHSSRGFRAIGTSATPTTPSRALRSTPMHSQRSPFVSPSIPTTHAGPALFPLTLVRQSQASNSNGLFTQAPWSLPPLDAPSAMLLTAIAMALDENDPSPASAPHVGLYWGKSTERTKFFDHVVTIIRKLCFLLDGVTDSTIVFEAVSADRKDRQMRYRSRAIDSMPSGGQIVDDISAQFIALAAQAHESTFKVGRRNQYDSEKDVLGTWASNGGFLPAKWADAPLPIRFDHNMIPAILSVLHSGATRNPPSPFLNTTLINFALSPPIRFQPCGLGSVTPLHSLMSATADLGISANEVSVDDKECCSDEDDGEEWMPFAKYKGLEAAIEGAWCTRFDIAPEFADGIRIMLYKEHPRDWATYLKRYTKARAAVIDEMVEELESYVTQLDQK
ncbi:hypothetical protein FRC01_014054 [Tulasnella sp. 417]|nr:hypothetical protein FRC01_014054 [Tulasnella sp. 417]